MTLMHSMHCMEHRVSPRDDLDFYPTPLWATRALCEWIARQPNHWPGHMHAWDPACGAGHMVRALCEYFEFVIGSDIASYAGSRHAIDDFLACQLDWRADWIITNPPFSRALEFARVALTRADVGVALLVRTAFLESRSRYGLFRERPPTDVLQYVERVVMHKGKVSRSGSTATAYCWVVWQNVVRDEPTRLHWIAPCRARLERPGDWE